MKLGRRFGLSECFLFSFIAAFRVNETIAAPFLGLMANTGLSCLRRSTWVARSGDGHTSRRLLGPRLMQSGQRCGRPAAVERASLGRAWPGAPWPRRRRPSRDRWLDSFVGNGIKSDVASRRRDLRSCSRDPRATNSPRPTIPRPRRPILGPRTHGARPPERDRFHRNRRSIVSTRFIYSAPPVSHSAFICQ